MREELASRKYILPGWRLFFEEVSNNVYEITLLDESARQAGIKGYDLEGGIRQCAEYAFDIEKQINKNWNEFTFEAALIELTGREILTKRFDNNTFGSWFIELANERIIGDGKESLLIKQKKVESEWQDEAIFNLKNLTYKQFLIAIQENK